MKQAAESSGAYASYLAARDAIFRMLENDTANAHQPSEYWKEEIEGFGYLFDASPLIVNTLRHHSYHITGLSFYDYKSHHQHTAGAFKQKLQSLQELDASNLLVSEPRALGGFGYEIDGKLYNIDTLKFYEYMVGLDRAGFLAPFKKNEQRQVALEIGPGWGGFAYQFKKLFPNTTYVMVELPETMIFCGTYLASLFPQAKIVFLDGTEKEISRETLLDADFIFIPSYQWSSLAPIRFDLAMNMVSFQEMTSEQVEEYIAKLATDQCTRVYSLNRDKSPHNTELTSVSGILKKYYTIEKITVHPTLQYMQMTQPVRKKTPVQKIKSFIKKVLALPIHILRTTRDTKNELEFPQKKYSHIKGTQ